MGKNYGKSPFLRGTKRFGVPSAYIEHHLKPPLAGDFPASHLAGR